jgi:hypothetical protein
LTLSSRLMPIRNPRGLCFFEESFMNNDWRPICMYIVCFDALLLVVQH